tara:strand:- start:332 stop:1342 length:1011 start_codon:yes stop_codon:yes gene_type:complete
MSTSKIFITGSAGFVGFHLASLLLEEGFIVHGYDGLTDYYDVSLKKDRHSKLFLNKNFSATIGMLEDHDSLWGAARDFQPDVIVHLAAQAGVRYSLENPRAYIDSNIIGTFNVMEIARELNVKHLLMASTSSVYGANKNMPFNELERVETPLTIYAATKKANETMAHSYAHLYGIPTTMFRFFTVYGPWGRPDMALFKFTKGILEGTMIDIYNNGEMYRDFTFVTDLVQGIKGLINTIPANEKDYFENDSLSPVAPFRVVNIGNSEKVKLLDFIEAIEEELGIKANRNYMEMQTGDVPATWADTQLISNLTGFEPKVSYREGVSKFISWYKDYFKV